MIVYYCRWSYILYQMIDLVSSKGLQRQGLWEQVEIPLLIFQSGAVFEVKLLFFYSNDQLICFN